MGQRTISVCSTCSTVDQPDIRWFYSAVAGREEQRHRVDPIVTGVALAESVGAATVICACKGRGQPVTSATSGRGETL